MLNKFIGIGMVGNKGVELRYTPSGKAVANFNLGIKRQFKNQEGNYEWDNFGVVVWGNQAEPCANYLKEKSLVSVEGHLQTRTYQDKDGQKRWITEIVSESVQFLSPKDSNSPETPSKPTSSFGHEVNLDDDIPF